MAWTIPDKGEAESDIQSYVYQEDLEIAITDIEMGSYVRSGLLVAAQGTPNMTVNVPTGVAYSLGFRFPVAANASLAIAAADASNPRLDYVVVTSTGVLAVRTGTPAPINTIKPPARTSGDVALAQVYIPAGATTITTIRIQDRRGMLPNMDSFQTEYGPYDNFLSVFPASGTTTVSVRGGAPVTSSGTLTHPTPTAGRINQLWRAQFASVVTTVDQPLGWWYNSAALHKFWRGNAANQGGFYFRGKMTLGAWTTGDRYFQGLDSVGACRAISNTLAGDICGLWHDATMADTVLNFITRDNVTTTSVAITLATAMATGQGYELIMYCKPNDTVLYYKVIDMLTGNTLADSFTSTTLPRNTVFMSPQQSMSNGANTPVTAAATGIVECLTTSPTIRT